MKGPSKVEYISAVNYPVHRFTNLKYTFALFCSFSLLRSEIDISSENVTYFHRVWFQNWICDIVESFEDTIIPQIYRKQIHLSFKTCFVFLLQRKDKCY